MVDVQNKKIPWHILWKHGPVALRRKVRFMDLISTPSLCTKRVFCCHMQKVKALLSELIGTLRFMVSSFNQIASPYLEKFSKSWHKQNFPIKKY